MILESEDEKDLKRACMVLSKGREVVGPGYSRLSRGATRVTDEEEESGNPNLVDRVHREYDTDWQTDQVTQDSWGNQDGYTGQQADQITQDSRGNQDYDSGQRADWVTWHSQGNQDSGSGHQADWVTRVSRGNRDSNPMLGKLSWVTENLANTESRGTENSADTKGRVMEDSANTESHVTQNVVNEESRVTQHSGNMEHWVRQDSEGKNAEVRKDATLSRRLAPWCCPRGITKMQKRRLQRCIRKSWPRRRKKKGLLV
jgi:hypothetical protein